MPTIALSDGPLASASSEVRLAICQSAQAVERGRTPISSRPASSPLRQVSSPANAGRIPLLWPWAVGAVSKAVALGLTPLAPRNAQRSLNAPLRPAGRTGRSPSYRAGASDSAVSCGTAFFMRDIHLTLLERSSILLTMNKLSIDRRAAVIRGLVEGSSIRAVARMTGTDKDTVMRLLVEVGEFCSIYQDHTLRNLPCKRVEADEIWSFVGAKARNAKPGQGDLWTFTAICSDSKLAVSWLVGPRITQTAKTFMADVASRLANRVQLTTDGLHMYYTAVEDAFGWNGVDYAQLAKTYGQTVETGPGRRYSPAVCIGAVKEWVMGRPDMDKVSTSYVERANLTMRMQMRRFTRLTNAFSKKAENHAHAVSLHFMFYNYCRPHTTLTKAANGVKTTPAMAAGLTNHVWTVEHFLDLMDPTRLLR